MISIEAWRAAIGSFTNNRLGISFIMYGSENVNRYYCVIALLVLPFTVFGLVMLFSSMLLKPKCMCTDYSFYTCVLMDMMFAAWCYFCDRVLLLSGDVELNPGPFKSCPACNASIHIKRVCCECGFSFKTSRHIKTLENEELLALSRKNNLASQWKKRALETEENSRIRRESDCLSHRKKRALETEENSRIRRESDCLSHRKKRALETEEDSKIRKQKDSESVSKRRKLESNEQRSQRLQQDRACKARCRQFETDYETQVRQHKNKITQAQRRQCSTIDKAVAKFLSKIATGADFVCTSCHRLLYHNSVVTCNRDKYNKSDIASCI